MKVEFQELCLDLESPSIFCVDKKSSPLFLKECLSLKLFFLFSIENV